MRGDFSRLRFEKNKHYTSVLALQGRPELDSDLNEQRFIDQSLRETETFDVVGAFGGPKDNAGFAIAVAGSTIEIGAGRYYVNGILCENQAAVAYGNQTYLINPPVADSDLLNELASGSIDSIRLYLAVWQRMVTALDDACLREPALGQADTTARIQTVWRVIAEATASAGTSGPRVPLNLTDVLRTAGLSSKITEAVISGPAPTSPSPSPSVSPAVSAATTLAAPFVTTAATHLMDTGASTFVSETAPESALTSALRDPAAGIMTNLGGLTQAPASGGTVPTQPGGSTPVPAPVPAPAPDCCAEMYLPASVAVTGSMSAQTTGGSTDCSCQPTPAAGYRGLENQLYRVEIHNAGDQITATFKWSRENGSVEAAVTGISGADVMVDSLGPDANLGFQPGQWVELSDDTYLFGPTPNQSGELFLIKSVSAEHLTITMSGPVAQIDVSKNARVRRWEQSGGLATSNGVALAAGAWMDLENGIQVQFGNGTFVAGDYWLIPARTASGQIEWPPCGSNGAAFQPPRRTEIVRAPLACIHWDSTAKQAQVEDCRRLFPALTEIHSTAGSSAIHVTGINWANDATMTFDQLILSGLTVNVDAAVTGPVSSASFAVALEIPIAAAGEAAAVADKLPPIVLRTDMPLDGVVTAIGATTASNAAAPSPPAIQWQFPYNNSNDFEARHLPTVRAINALLLQGTSYGVFARARVRILGNAIFNGTGANQLFLDGQCLGAQGTLADGVTPRLDLQMPSGIAQPASDFVSWFYLAPFLQLTGLTSSASAVSVTFSAPPPVVTGSVTVNYPPIADTVINLSVTPPAGAQPSVRVPATVTVPKGSASASFNITVANTGNPQAESFQVVATLPAPLGLQTSQIAPLAVTGVAVIQ